jgi:alpha-ribazole phosphatase
MTRFWWLRHAPVITPGITGQLDVDADTSNTAAFTGLAARLPGGAVLVESGLRRCRQTADALRGTGLALPEPEIHPTLMEQNFGDWQGKRWDEFEAPEFWRAPASAVPPQGESFSAVVTRVGPAIQQLSRRHADRDIVVIAHAGPIRAALAIAMGISSAAALQFAVAPLSLTRLTLAGGGWTVEGVNG